jgi:beta-lactamase superfamily II metal-dependent hydrolase
LVAPHHGKHFKPWVRWIRQFKPKLVLVSAPTTYMAPATLASLHAEGLPIVITGRHGGIEVHGGQNAVSVVPTIPSLNLIDSREPN